MKEATKFLLFINPPARYEEEERLRLLREGFDDIEIDVFFGASSSEEDGEEQGTFSPERIQAYLSGGAASPFCKGAPRPRWSPALSSTSGDPAVGPSNWPTALEKIYTSCFPF
ncbi:hypothetical protein Zmor_025045 [Zophobas morio]|uniref:Uncharacterized protein n=1 Tax=Zophobas morio TaxID=2755281 RepID=A0AA38HT45_9CUCU|nr:hypothetical protein Zmor_025045 [Zophobas morio]